MRSDEGKVGPEGSGIHAASAVSGPRCRQVACGLLMLIFVLSLAALPAPAFAAGGVQCTGFSFQAPASAQASDPAPGAAYYLCVKFDKNVSFAREGQDGSFVQENLAKVHLRTATGADVENSWTSGAHDMNDRQLVYVWIGGWLDPLTEYHVVVDPGIQAANGEDVSAEGYAFAFKTDDRLESGWSVFQVACVPVVLGALAAGVGVQAVRVTRRRRR